MLVTLKKTYTVLPYDGGTVENKIRTATAEISDTADDTPGLTLGPGEKLFFNKPIYARSTYPGVKLAVISSSGGGGGGGEVPEDEIATDQEVEDMLDNVFPVDETAEAGAGEDTVEGDGPSLD